MSVKFNLAVRHTNVNAFQLLVPYFATRCDALSLGLVAQHYAVSFGYPHLDPLLSPCNQMPFDVLSSISPATVPSDLMRSGSGKNTTESVHQRHQFWIKILSLWQCRALGLDGLA